MNYSQGIIKKSKGSNSKTISKASSKPSIEIILKQERNYHSNHYFKLGKIRKYYPSYVDTILKLQPLSHHDSLIFFSFGCMTPYAALKRIECTSFGGTLVPLLIFSIVAACYHVMLFLSTIIYLNYSKIF